jgi:hypothetical protein
VEQQEQVGLQEQTVHQELQEQMEHQVQQVQVEQVEQVGLQEMLVFPRDKYTTSMNHKIQMFQDIKF